LFSTKPDRKPDNLSTFGGAYHRQRFRVRRGASAVDQRPCLNRQLGLNWEQFCKQHAGCSYKTADRIIDRFREFGEAYFNLSQIVNIPAAEYRELQPAIEDNTLDFEGRRIAINRENTQQLIEAVRTLRSHLEKSEDKDPYAGLQAHLDRAIGELAGAVQRSEGRSRPC